MDFDGALGQIGEFGWYQRKIFVLISLAAVPCYYQMLLLVFVAATPKWTCPEDSKANSIPCKDNCCTPRGVICDRASFTTNFTSIATEWNLVCGEAYKNELAQSIFMAGTLIGAPLMGSLADKHGRRKIWVISYFLSGGLAFLSGLSPSYGVFVALRFVVGMFAGGAGLINFVLCTESIGPSYRGFAGTMLQIFFALGVASLGLLAYLVPDWRNLTIATSVPTIFGFFILNQVTESPRWLASQGRYEEAEAILQRMASQNGLSATKQVSLRRTKMSSKTGASSRSYGILDLFTNRNTTLITLIMIISWFANSHVYYGLSLNVKNLGGNMYVNFILAGLVEIPSYVLTVFLLNWSGRRKSLFYFMMGAAGSCYMCMKLQQQESHNPMWLSVAAMFGKFCISASFGVVYVYAAELFPTVIRNVGMGVATVASRFGGILCPFVVLMGEQSRSLPMFIFACISLVAGLAGLKLPETKGRPMPETMEDLERLQHDHSKSGIR
ncbi:solute carrier family 22 member 15-like [Montipora capricornis]|uniref:solute carrier family 22 member 15-like n=1 Tax=Montipora capricornis TaxID=246305 RepID=UPI0035F218AF